ncbi:hypothetical protein SAMN05660976_04650 [Nonomuraea pusilla]|uniref:Uncharacterized protein n=2 Tax=Nonomuraea pusilla TaxID=46177 RepID=A0A1H7WWX5_9ACTN|nr:hypothetical protein SAMN05660976_04650 [Nonomuraea pusilla]
MLTAMTNGARLNLSEGPEPGTELFSSHRAFKLWAYSPSHSRLLLRSSADPDPQLPDLHETTVEILFAPVDAIKVNSVYDGLTIRRATLEEADGIKAAARLDGGGHVLILESRGIRDHVVTGGICWHEGVLSPTRLSFFAGILPDQPAWPRHPLGPGYDAGLDIASAEELVHELTTDDTSSKPRGKYRTIYTVVTRVEHQTRSGAPEIEIAGAGAFLTRSEAEDFQARLKPVVADSWVEEIPIAI